MQILYLYKIVLHAVPNPDFVWTYCPRNKLSFTPKTSAKQGWIHTLRNSSFAVIGPKLFNSIPKELRELPDLSKTTKENIRAFKVNVDKYLSTIPDIPGRANSLLDHEGIDYGYKFVLNKNNNNKQWQHQQHQQHQHRKAEEEKQLRSISRTKQQYLRV